MHATPASPPAEPLRHEFCLNGLWNFKSDADDAWTQIRVPGAYAGVREFWGGEHWDTFDHPPHWLGKGAVYRRAFSLPPALRQMPQIRFACGGCYHHGRVLVNGTEVGDWHDGYAVFEFRIDHCLREGENDLRVVVSEHESDFFDDYRQVSRGIWQDTFLRGLGELAIERDRFVTTSVRDGRIRHVVPVTNGGTAARTCAVRNFVLAADGRVAMHFDGPPLEVAAGGRAECTCEADWADARLWAPHDPYLYRLQTVLYDEQGQAVDATTQRFGFREITWEGPHLYLNGHELYLRGHGGHYQGDLQGTRAYMEHWLGSLKANGVNFMRLHDSPKHACLYEVADEVGMLLEAEPVHHFQVPKDPAIWQPHLDQFVKRYRNHPSVILWSVSNELRWRGGGEKPELIDFVKTLDRSRPVFASDFSLESRHGDVLGHHYNPKTCFEEWQAFGPDKAMVWDELGSVWQHDRALDNGTAGLECSSQDYATGCWYDGHDQILTDLQGVHDGRVIDGELHRVNAYCVWDLGYNFFRWQPINKHRPLLLEHETLAGPGLKNKLIRPCSATVNPWDPTLPVMEANPGFHIFHKYMQPVRFFDSVERKSFWAGETVELTTDLFYEDLRPADQLRCLIRNERRETLSGVDHPIELRPGQILRDLHLRFVMPEVAEPTRLRLVRQFVCGGTEGHACETTVTVYPRRPAAAGLAGKRIAVLGRPERLPEALGQLGARFEHVDDAPTPGQIDVLVHVADAPTQAPALEAFVQGGGRLVQLLAPPPDGSAGAAQAYQIDEVFRAEEGRIFDGQSHCARSLSSGLAWQGWAPDGGTVHMQTVEALVSNENSRLVFEGGAEPGSYAWAPFETGQGGPFRLLDLRAGQITISYMSSFGDEHEDRRERDDRDRLERTIGLLARDAGGRWFRSTPQTAMRLAHVDTYESDRLAIDPGDLTWEAVRHADGDGPQGPLTPEPDAPPPDWTEVTGIGICLYEMPYLPLALWINHVVVRGKALPSARVPLNGPKHRLLTGLAQESFTHWQGGSCDRTWPLPDDGNFRVVLAGNKDGDDAALLEEFRGAGTVISTAANVLRDAATEPAAAWLLHNMLTHAAAFAPRPAARTGVMGGACLTQFLGEIGLVGEPLGPHELARVTDYGTIVVDAGEPKLTTALVEGASRIRTFVEAGGQVVLCGIDPDTIAACAAVLDTELALTDPFLGERGHCVKAAISWTRRDTPADLVEYYDGVLIPQPFEPNYDPLISGIANADLSWDGEPMFKHGVEIRGMDPVEATDRYGILISNWQIDWSKPDFGGEYTHEARDMRRADWFINRDPVVLRLSRGKGCFLCCQLDLARGGAKGRRVARQLLTGLGCALGSATALPCLQDTFDFTARDDQLARFERTRVLTAPAVRRHYGKPNSFRAKQAVREEKRIRALMIGNHVMQQYAVVTARALADTHEVTVAPDLLGTTRECLARLDNALAGRQYETVLFSFDLADLACLSADGPTVPREEFATNVAAVVARLKTTGAKLYWTTSVPVPAGCDGYASDHVADYNATAVAIMDQNDVYTVDLHGFVLGKCPAFVRSAKVAFDAEERQRVGNQVAQAVAFFGAQQ